MVLRSRFAAAISEVKGTARSASPSQELAIYGALMCAKGLGQASTGFVTTALLDESVPVAKGYGATKWRAVIIFVGAMHMAASLGVLGRCIGRRKKSESVDDKEDVEMEVVYYRDVTPRKTDGYETDMRESCFQPLSLVLISSGGPVREAGRDGNL